MLCFGLPPQQPLKKVEPLTGAHDTGGGVDSWDGTVHEPEVYLIGYPQNYGCQINRIGKMKKKKKKFHQPLISKGGLRSKELVCLFLLC